MGEAITKDQIGGTARVIKDYIAPFILSGIVAVGAFFTIRNDLTKNIDNVTRHESEIGSLRTQIDGHYNELVSLRAQQIEWRSMMDLRFGDLDRRFQKIDNQLDNINTTLRALLMQDRQQDRGK